jgi:TolB protein
MNHRCWPSPRTRVFFLLICVTVLLYSAPATGRMYIDINSPLQKKIPIAIPAFRHDGGDTPDQQVGKRLAETLSGALSFSAFFQPLDPAVFLQDPRQMGVELQEIKFPEWSFLGADFLIRGSYRLQGERLEVVVRLFDVIHQTQLLKKAYSGNLKSARQLILRFADDMMVFLTGEPGIFQTRIAFESDVTGHKEIYLADFDGANIHRLTHDNGLDLSPVWLPDGKKISFVSYKKANPDLYTMDLASNAVECISQRPGLNIAPAWHPAGGKLAATLTINGNPELYLLDSRGEILRQLTVNWGIDVSPSWSPDGRKLAFVSDRAGKPQIYIMDLASGNTSRLTFEGDYNVSPAWSPRGDLIVYAGLHEGHFDLFLISPDGRDLRQLTGGTGNNENPCWSPDGRMILFQSDRQDSNTLWVMLANGTEQRRLHLDLGGSHTDPAWSPRLTWTTP